MTEKYQPIPHRLKNMAVGGHVAGAEDIDAGDGKTQQDINADTYRKDETYSKEQLNNMITTPEQKYENYTAEDGDTFSDLGLPAEGEADTTYRVGSWDGTEYNASKFSEYSWDGTQYVLLSVQSPGIDDEPTVFSKNLATSDGIITDTLIGRSVTQNNPYIDENHACSYNNGVMIRYGVFTTFDALWVRCIDGATKIRFSGIDTEIIGYFSGTKPIPAECIGCNTTGTIPAGTKLIVVNLLKANNPDGYGNLKIYQNSKVYVEDVSQADYSFIREHNRNVIAERGGVSVDYGHLLNIPSVGTYEYVINSRWDCVWIPIPENCTKVTLHVSDYTDLNYRFISTLKESEISADTYLGLNSTGLVIPNAVACLVNINKSNYAGNYDGLYAEYELGYVTNEYLDEVFGDNITYQKNLININDLLNGYILNDGQIVERTNGKMSNKIVFQDGITYAFQGIQYYGNKNKIYICHFDEEDNFIGSTSQPAIINPEMSRHVGKCLYKYSENAKPGTAYCRVVLQTTYGTLHTDECQIEVGTEYTEVVTYNAKQIYIPKSKGGDVADKKKIRLLSIGNSYSQDALAYVPFIMENMAINVDYQIGILMKSSASLATHVECFEEETEAYTFYFYNGGGAWQNFGLKSIQWALDTYQWDIVTLQQSSKSAYSWETYQPSCNQLINLVSAYVDYGIKWVWYQPYARPAKNNASISTGDNYTDAEITEHYENTAAASQRLMNEAVIEYVVPVGTAIQNARTISSIKAMGAYATAPNNSSGLGYLAYSDGVHLQEGLPCQIAAYTFIMSLLDIYGFDNLSIVGETSRITSDWAAGKAIPGPHGEYIGSTDENCLIAQLSVIMAMKKKFEVTDMNYIINPT